MKLSRKIVISAVVSGIVGVIAGIAAYSYLKRPVKLDPIDIGQGFKPVYVSTVRISSDQGICTAFVVSKNYAITAGHCLVGQLGKKFKVYGQKFASNEPAQFVTTTVAARILGYGGLDAGLLKGNFEQFYYAEIEEGEIKLAPLLVSCGFAGGSLTSLCRPLMMPELTGFIAAARGHLVPGMSGGPIINPFTGHVIGINSGQLDSYAFFTPTTKILDFLGVRTLEDTQ